MALAAADDLVVLFDSDMVRFRVNDLFCERAGSGEDHRSACLRIFRVRLVTGKKVLIRQAFGHDLRTTISPLVLGR